MPNRESVTSTFLFFIEPLTLASTSSAYTYPCTIKRCNKFRPDTPNTSEMTLPSLMFPASRNFWLRFFSAVREPIRFLRSRQRSRSSLRSSDGTKLSSIRSDPEQLRNQSRITNVRLAARFTA